MGTSLVYLVKAFWGLQIWEVYSGEWNILGSASAHNRSDCILAWSRERPRISLLERKTGVKVFHPSCHLCFMLFSIYLAFCILMFTFFQCFIIMYLYSISLEYLYSNSFQNGIPSSGCGAPQYGGSISVLFFSCCPGTTTSIHSVCGDPCEVEQSVLVMSYEALPTLTSWLKEFLQSRIGRRLNRHLPMQAF